MERKIKVYGYEAAKLKHQRLRLICGSCKRIVPQEIGFMYLEETLIKGAVVCNRCLERPEDMEIERRVVVRKLDKYFNYSKNFSGKFKTW